MKKGIDCLEAFDFYDSTFFQALNGVEEFAFLFPFQTEVLKHFQNWGACPPKPAKLISKIVNDETFNSPTLPCCVSEKNS